MRRALETGGTSRARRLETAGAGRARRLETAGASRARQQETAGAAGRGPLVGRDLARSRVLERGRRRLFPFALAGLVIAALGVAALRIDLIRMRYGLADAMAEERALLEQRRVALLELRRQRDPARLTDLARRRGFERPARIVDLSSRRSATTTGAAASGSAAPGSAAEGR
jgi:hypothetical protein